MTDHTLWCRTLFEKLADDEYWAIPRSGMVFRKSKAAKSLVWVGSFPPNGKIMMPSSLARAHEFLRLLDEFSKAGISIEMSAVKEYDNIDEAISDQKTKMMVRLS